MSERLDRLAQNERVARETASNNVMDRRNRLTSHISSKLLEMAATLSSSGTKPNLQTTTSYDISRPMHGDSDPGVYAAWVIGGGFKAKVTGGGKSYPGLGYSDTRDYDSSGTSNEATYANGGAVYETQRRLERIGHGLAITGDAVVFSWRLGPAGVGLVRKYSVDDMAMTSSQLVTLATSEGFAGTDLTYVSEASMVERQPGDSRPVEEVIDAKAVDWLIFAQDYRER